MALSAPVVHRIEGRKPLALAIDGRIAPLPIPGLRQPQVDGIVPTGTIEKWTAGLRNPAGRAAIMRSAGYVDGAVVRYKAGDDIYDVTVLQFRDEAGASEYAEAHMYDLCDRAKDVRDIPEVAGVAFNWQELEMSDGSAEPRARALFVAGDSEVQLSICVCVEVQDRLSVAADWARSVARQLAEGTR